MGVKKYFSREFKKEMFSLEHDNGADFYLTCWQRNRSPIPMLFLRFLIFAVCVGTLLASMIMIMPMYGVGNWFIFLTHWGVVLNTAASGCALVVSLKVFFKGPIDATLALPWYVKAYWVLFNIATPIAFFITLFYWSLLTEFVVDGEVLDFALDPVLDVFIHGANSILMLALLLISRHPTRLLHFYLPILVAVIYMILTIIFHFAGGISPFGTSWIYPMLDWDKPGMALVVVVGAAIGITLMHFIAVGITVCRDKLTQKYRESNSLPISSEAR